MTADTQKPQPGKPVAKTGNVEHDASQAAPLAPGATLGTNTISRLLATSDSGYTYLANEGATVVQEYFPLQFAVRDTDGVSLLLCDAQFNSDFEQGLTEFLLLARVLSQLDHPGRVGHYEENDGAAWYSIDLPVRASLADLLETGQRLPEETLKTILYSAITYLDAAHGAGALHLELTPTRLLLAEEDQLVICGFSTDKFHYPPADQSSAHDLRAPELASFRGQLGPWTDYYALGAILYQGACRTAPTDALARLEAADHGLNDTLTPAVKTGRGFFSQSILSLIDRLLCLDPTARPQNAAELLEALDPGASPTVDETETSDLSAEVSQSGGQGPSADGSRSRGHDSGSTAGADSGASVANRVRGASTIVLSALDKTESAIKAPNPVPSDRQKTQSFSQRTVEARTPTSRREPVITGGLHDPGKGSPSRDTAPADRAPLTIADDLETAGQLLAEPNFDDFSLRPQRRESTRSSRGTAGSVTQAAGPGSGKPTQWLPAPLRGYSVRFSIGVLLVLVVVYLLYLLVTPPGATENTPSSTTIEIIGATDLTPGQSPELEIGQATFTGGDTNTETTDFSRPDDLARANAYRDAETLSQLSEPHLARAQIYLDQGHLISPPDANAFSEFKTVLKMNPDSTSAQHGLEKVTDGIIANIHQLAKGSDFSGARELLGQAIRTIGDQPPLTAARSKIDEAEKSWEQKQALAKLEAEKAQREREQKQKIERLLAEASAAFDADHLRTPPEENALALYRAVLTLDPQNRRARNGIDRITGVYLDQARDALARNQFGQAARGLEAAAATDPTNPNVVILSTQLQRRQYLEAEQQRLQAEADDRMSKAQAMADEHASLNLASGVKAYYDGDYNRAFQFLAPLAAGGEPQAQIRVARMLLEARGTDRDKPRAIAMFSSALAPVQLAAREGSAWAQSDLADYYVDGFVIDKDLGSAAFWYRKAAEQGYAPAQTNLGWLYFNGYEGVAPNRAVAVHWFSEAAAQGNRTAVKNLQALGEEIPGQGGS